MFGTGELRFIYRQRRESAIIRWTPLLEDLSPSPCNKSALDPLVRPAGIWIGAGIWIAEGKM